ncbi:rifin PIR protein, putative [Plasmodium reichenowi]|uniref:Rifin PIR protein, putative n=1 Tax=Plasmodium reichenowi TaxID=5854 RepID=A0A2P9DS98_PLARE|nr:rifin PIR protein, putative [Plasmodium reichenowi]
MKLHYSKILLFFLPLNILVTSSSNVHNKNKIYITQRDTPTYKSRVLSEGDTQSSRYDNDAEIKLVKENFDQQTSQRLREYDERLQEKRQKRKEQHDKNIQEIIDKDKMDKSLAEKIEKGCLRCGCGLGGVAASVGLFGGLGIYGWKMGALATAEKVGAAEGATAAKAVGAEEGVKALIKGLEDGFGIQNLYNTPLANFITTDSYCDADLIANSVKDFYKSFSESELTPEKYFLFSTYKSMQEAERNKILVRSAKTIVGDAVRKANDMTVKVTESKIAEFEIAKVAEVESTYVIFQNALIASVVALLIIVLVMIIIYLVLRYKRKKKMNKKAQYTKLLKE